MDERIVVLEVGGIGKVLSQDIGTIILVLVAVAVGVFVVEQYTDVGLVVLVVSDAVYLTLVVDGIGSAYRIGIGRDETFVVGIIVRVVVLTLVHRLVHFVDTHLHRCDGVAVIA